MAADKMDIVHSSILDNEDESLVEFMAEVDGDEYQFAVQYAVLEALSGDAPEDDAVEQFNRFEDAIAEAGLVALARNADQAMIVISENDLE
jgi:hypothetical protein